jgi:hypothetical protein
VRIRLAAVLCLMWSLPTAATAQVTLPATRFRVALDVTDPPSGASFLSILSAAFRALGDVDLVDSDAEPDLVVRVVAMCNTSECAQASQYAVAIQLSQPLSQGVASVVASAASGQQMPSDSVVRLIREVLPGFEQHHNMWVALWGKQRYEQAARELVGRIDAQCLERKRIVDRALRQRREGENTFEIIRRRTEGREWIC